MSRLPSATKQHNPLSFLAERTPQRGSALPAAACKALQHFKVQQINKNPKPTVLLLLRSLRLEGLFCEFLGNLSIYGGEALQIGCAARRDTSSSLGPPRGPRRLGASSERFFLGFAQEKFSSATQATLVIRIFLVLAREKLRSGHRKSHFLVFATEKIRFGDVSNHRA